MKNLFGLALVCLAASFLCGCSTTTKEPEPVYHTGDENPPNFLVSPVATVLTNYSGFSGHLAARVSFSDGGVETNAGDLLVGNGRLLYQPVVPVKPKKGEGPRGFFFIWDESKHSGLVLSEALQGYAPIAPPINGLEVKSETNAGVASAAQSESINGHLCHRSDKEFTLANGIKVKLALWQADDVDHFPARIQCSNGHDTMTLDFSEIRQSKPSQELFMPPDGFARFASSEALVAELVMRDATLTRRKQRYTDDSSESHNGNWHPMPTSHE